MVMVAHRRQRDGPPWEDRTRPRHSSAWYPGEEGGRAVADALFGDLNPAGHLPLTFYRATATCRLRRLFDEGRTYRYFRGEPLYAFGHGLSYTTFRYSDLKITPEKGDAQTTFQASVSDREQRRACGGRRWCRFT